MSYILLLDLGQRLLLLRQLRDRLLADVRLLLLDVLEFGEFVLLLPFAHGDAARESILYLLVVHLLRHFIFFQNAFHTCFSVHCHSMHQVWPGHLVRVTVRDRGCLEKRRTELLVLCLPFLRL